MELYKEICLITDSISFNLLSFFSMSFVVDSRLVSYRLVPEASSIIDKIWIKWDQIEDKLEKM